MKTKLFFVWERIAKPEVWVGDFYVVALGWVGLCFKRGSAFEPGKSEKKEGKNRLRGEVKGRLAGTRQGL